MVDSTSPNNDDRQFRSFDELDREANTLSRLGRYEESIAVWAQLTELMPDNWRYALGLALDLRRKGQYLESDRVFHEATKRFSNEFWIIFHWALAAYEDRKFDDAEKRALHSLESGRLRMEPYALLGDIAAARFLFNDAQRHFANAMRIAPDDATLTKRWQRSKRFAQLSYALSSTRSEVNDPNKAADYGVLVINLDERRDRFTTICQFFEDSPVNIERVPGVRGGHLPEAVLRHLCRSSVLKKGTAGCFLAHVSAWETCLKRGFTNCLILEDDAIPRFRLPLSFDNLSIPDDFDLCFVNSRMEPQNVPEGDKFTFHDPIRCLASFPPGHNAPGGDGYFISAAGARKLLQFVQRDGYGGDVDWRLVAYSMRKGGAEILDLNSIAGTVLRSMDNFPEPRLRSYVLYPSLFYVESKDSDRVAQD